MIRDWHLSLLLLLLAPQLGSAEPLEHVPDKTLETYRTPINVLTERAIGKTSRPVRYDWRRDTLQMGLMGGLPAELNNYDSLKAGFFVRFPVSNALLEVGLSHVWVSASQSSRNLALTPYRQPGRPERYELDFTYSYPLAEGIITAFPAFMPSTQLVLSAHVQFRYLIYPSAFEDLEWTETLKALVRGSLSSAEIENLESERLPAMTVDPARYAALAGLGNDLYFQSGFFFSHKVLLATPLLNFLNDTELGYGFELDVALGFGF